MTVHLDFETYSECDLKRLGSHVYAAHRSTEVLCFVVKEHAEGSKPLLWVHPSVRLFMEHQSGEAMVLLVEADEIIAHNAEFEAPVLRYWFGMVAIRWVCTKTMALRARIPASLAKVGAFLNLAQQKDTKGAALIRRFCIPQKPTKKRPEVHRIKPTDDLAGFKELCDYCVQDVLTEELVYNTLQSFDYPGMPRQVYAATMQMNLTGFPVDLQAIDYALEIIETRTKAVTDEFLQLTGGIAPTQTKALLPWLQSHGYPGTNMQAATMEQELEDALDESTPATMDEVGRRALELRAQMSFAAIKKLSLMRAMADDRQRVCGTLVDCGAGTGRWTSEKVQQQNFKRSTYKHSEAAFEMIRNRVPVETIELFHGPIIEVLSNSIRHFINAKHEGRKLMAVDYSAIEARLICWEAGQADALQDFANGVDRYKKMATKIFNCHFDNVTKDQRFIGKQTVLGCGYQMSANKFIGTCANFGVEVTAELAELAVDTFRSEHPEIVKFWYQLDSAARRVIANPGQRVTVKCVELFCATVGGKRFLFIKLPSGRHLAYPEPMIEHEDKYGSVKELLGDKGCITYYGQIPMKAIWGRIKTYGGKLAENITQAIATDCMGAGVVNAIAAGFEVAMVVHDECVAVMDPDRDEQEQLAAFTAELVRMPDWAATIPLAAEGDTMEVYRK
jgi:DNA polymerase